MFTPTAAQALYSAECQLKAVTNECNREVARWRKIWEKGGADEAYIKACIAEIRGSFADRRKAARAAVNSALRALDASL